MEPTKLEFSFPCPLLWNEIMKQAKIEEQISHKKAVLKDIEKYESKYLTKGHWFQYYDEPFDREVSRVIRDERLWYAGTEFIKCNDGESVDKNIFTEDDWDVGPTEWHHKSVWVNTTLGIYEDIYDDVDGVVEAIAAQLSTAKEIETMHG